MIHNKSTTDIFLVAQAESSRSHSYFYRKLIIGLFKLPVYEEVDGFQDFGALKTQIHFEFIEDWLLDDFKYTICVLKDFIQTTIYLY